MVQLLPVPQGSVNLSGPLTCCLHYASIKGTIFLLPCMGFRTPQINVWSKVDVDKEEPDWDHTFLPILNPEIIYGKYRVPKLGSFSQRETW